MATIQILIRSSETANLVEQNRYDLIASRRVLFQPLKAASLPDRPDR